MDYRQREIVVICRFHVSALLWIGITMIGISTLNAEELSRLFFSPAERKAMNERRTLPPPKPIASAARKESVEPDVKASAEVGESVRLPNPKITGKVIRSSGNDTIWFNQSPNYFPQRSRPPSRN